MITILIEVENLLAKFTLNKEIERHFLSGGGVDIQVGGYDDTTKKTLTVNAGKVGIK